MFLDFTRDWQTWDQTESVKLLYARRPTPPTGAADAGDSDLIPTAKRTAITRREKSPSGGVYTSGEINMRIPAALLPPGRALRPGDALIPTDPNRPDAGTRYTVLTANLRRQGSTWFLGCVDLKIAAGLFDVVNVERATQEVDSAGVRVKLWPSGPKPNGGFVLYDGLPCRVQTERQEVADARGIRGDAVRCSVILDRQVSLNVTEDRILVVSASDASLVGAYLDVKDVHNDMQLGELPALSCEKRP